VPPFPPAGPAISLQQRGEEEEEEEEEVALLLLLQVGLSTVDWSLLGLSTVDWSLLQNPLESEPKQVLGSGEPA